MTAGHMPAFPPRGRDSIQQLLQSSWSRWDDLGMRLFVYLKAQKIPPLPPAPSRKKADKASQRPLPPAPLHPIPSTTPNPSSRASTSGGSKRAHPTHGTGLDDVAPAPQRTRSTPAPPHPPSSASQPTLPRPRPTPLWRGYAPPSSQPSPMLHYPSPPFASSSLGPPLYTPTRNNAPHTLSVPSYYPALPSTPSQSYGGSTYSYYQNFSSPMPTSSPVPPNLLHNPYASLITTPMAPPRLPGPSFSQPPQNSASSASRAQPPRQPDLDDARDIP
ncbi:hypothetical protein C8R46DRAFT_1154226 [Mycena filopes]|nr:hypothetical protein C8R46DRAFT_1154226 [Mycena filopes]